MNPDEILARLPSDDRDHGLAGFELWLTYVIAQGGGSPWHQDDLQEAFLAGYAYASQFSWE